MSYRRRLVSGADTFLVRTNAAALAVLASVAAASWVLLAAGVGRDAPAAPAFLAGWTLMMAAMMLPSALPLVALYGRTRRPEPVAAGYLVVWAAFGVPVYALAAVRDVMDLPSNAVAATLVAAGVYQLTPLKSACLRRCRSPVSFLLERWGRNPFRLGVEHGAYCVGCCWALMAVLVVASAMGLGWAAAIALVVFAEKVLPAGALTARIASAILIALGVAVAVAPGIAAALTANAR